MIGAPWKSLLAFGAPAPNRWNPTRSFALVGREGCAFRALIQRVLSGLHAGHCRAPGVSGISNLRGCLSKHSGEHRVLRTEEEGKEGAWIFCF